MKRNPAERQRILCLLKECQIQGQPTPEQMEENLRWLVRLALPEAPAPERLRRRIQAIAEEHRARQAAQDAAIEALRDWPGLESVLNESEREVLSLLLSTDLRLLMADPQLCEEARQVVRRLLAVLPEPLREALLLQLRQGLSPEEIAQVLDRPKSETARLLRQARASIFRQAENGAGGLA